jgi:predicted P-loop ATPase
LDKRHLEAADTELNRAIGRKWLIAAVRQVRQPGCKFDFILVLIDEEGTGKSMVFVVLAGEENFSDQTILTLNDRAQQETMEGVWVLEIADLGGMKTADSELVKAFASRRNHYHR